MAAPDDDLLNPDEIEALLNAAAGGGGASKPTGPKPQPNDSALLDPSEIEALLAQSAAAPRETKPSAAKPAASKPSVAAPKPPAAIGAQRTVAAASRSPKSGPESLLQSAQDQLAAAIAPNLDRGRAAGSPNAKPYQFEAFEPAAGPGGGELGLNVLQDVQLDLCIELGRTELLIEEVLQLREGSVVPLDKLAGDPVDILVNGRLIARGEVLVLNDNFCVRIAEILSPQL